MLQINFNFYVFYPGLRARMGAGYSQMNDLTIIQTAQVNVWILNNPVALLIF